MTCMRCGCSCARVRHLSNCVCGHIDLYFFHDLDVIMLNVEVFADELPLAQVQDLLYRFGRGYPPGWDAHGGALHCTSQAAWLGVDGQVLAASDASERELYLDFVARHRSPRVAAHWRWLLLPLVPDQDRESAALRYRQIEYHRMPVMAYLALDQPEALSRADFVRLAPGRRAGPFRPWLSC